MLILFMEKLDSAVCWGKTNTPPSLRSHITPSPLLHSKCNPTAQDMCVIFIIKGAKVKIENVRTSKFTYLSFLQIKRFENIDWKVKVMSIKWTQSSLF